MGRASPRPRRHLGQRERAPSGAPRSARRREPRGGSTGAGESTRGPRGRGLRGAGPARRRAGQAAPAAGPRRVRGCRRTTYRRALVLARDSSLLTSRSASTAPAPWSGSRCRGPSSASRRSRRPSPSRSRALARLQDRRGRRPPPAPQELTLKRETSAGAAAGGHGCKDGRVTTSDRSAPGRQHEHLVARPQLGLAAHLHERAVAAHEADPDVLAQRPASSSRRRRPATRARP